VPRDARKAGGVDHLAPAPMRIFDSTALKVADKSLGIAIDPFPATQMAQDLAAQPYRRDPLFAVL